MCLPSGDQAGLRLQLPLKQSRLLWVSWRACLPFALATKMLMPGARLLTNAILFPLGAVSGSFS